MKLNKGLVLIKVDAAREADEDGIYEAEQWKTLPPTGTVIAVGMGVLFCKPKDRVMFERYSAVPTEIENERLVREDAVFKVL